MGESKKKSTQEIITAHFDHRVAVGLIGVFLGPVLLVVGLASGEGWLVTISHYHDTELGRDLFVGSLFAIATFFLTSSGPEPADVTAYRFAGVCVLGVALAPHDSAFGWLHYLSAVLVFATLAFISGRLFTRSRGHMTAQKKTRNGVYRCSSRLMLAVMVALGLLKAAELLEVADLDGVPHVFIGETVMLMAFGVSWVVKGEAFLADSEQEAEAKRRADHPNAPPATD